MGLTKAIANEVAHENIRVNGVAPGIIATKFASAVSVLKPYYISYIITIVNVYITICTIIFSDYNFRRYQRKNFIHSANEKIW